MKTIKNISLLLAFACALPVYADENQASTVETQPTENIEQKPNNQLILEASQTLSKSLAGLLYGSAAGAALMIATLHLTDSFKMALLGGGITAIAPIALHAYLYKKYKAQCNEDEFKDAMTIAKGESLYYTLPLLLALGTYFTTSFAHFGGELIGLITGAIAKKAGANWLQAGIAGAGVALTIPSYLEAHAMSKEKKQPSYYDKTMNFAIAYAKNLTLVSFLAGAAGAAVWINIPKINLPE